MSEFAYERLIGVADKSVDPFGEDCAHVLVGDPDSPDSANLVRVYPETLDRCKCALSLSCALSLAYLKNDDVVSDDGVVGIAVPLQNQPIDTILKVQELFPYKGKSPESDYFFDGSIQSVVYQWINNDGDIYAKVLLRVDPELFDVEFIYVVVPCYSFVKPHQLNWLKGITVSFFAYRDEDCDSGFDGYCLPLFLQPLIAQARIAQKLAMGAKPCGAPRFVIIPSIDDYEKHIERMLPERRLLLETLNIMYMAKSFTRADAPSDSR